MFRFRLLSLYKQGNNINNYDNIYSKRREEGAKKEKKNTDTKLTIHCKNYDPAV